MALPLTSEAVDVPSDFTVFSTASVPVGLDLLHGLLAGSCRFCAASLAMSVTSWARGAAFSFRLPAA